MHRSLLKILRRPLGHRSHPPILRSGLKPSRRRIFSPVSLAVTVSGLWDSLPLPLRDRVEARTKKGVGGACVWAGLKPSPGVADKLLDIGEF